MENYPLFTVIIPQKNRAEYLVHTLRTCMIQDYPNFEVIVSDDCSDDNSVEVARSMSMIDSRIRVFAHDHHLGMHDNFEFALNQVKPGYVMALGGDDGLIPGCISRMYQIIKETKKDLLTWNQAWYSYPDLSFDFSVLSLPLKPRSYKILKSKDYLQKINKTFDYMTDDCPMFYIKGVVSTEIVNRVKSRTPDHGFYYCPTPDGFSGVVLAGEVEEYVMSYEPLSIGGNSVKSQGQNYHRTDEKSKNEAKQFFQDNVRRTMHKELASQQYSPLVTLMTADYLLTARDLPGWPGAEYCNFTIKDLLKKSFDFISHSSFESETLIRELRILREIAIQHNEEELFNKLYDETKLYRSTPKMEAGFAYSNTKVRFSSDLYPVKNIYEASLAIPFIYNFFGNGALSIIKNVVKTDLKIAYEKVFNKKQTVTRMPSID